MSAKPALALLWLALAPSAWALSPREIFDTRADGVLLLASDMPDGGLKRSTACLVSAQGHVLASEHATQGARGVSAFLKPAKLSGDEGRDLQRQVQLRLLAADAGLDLALYVMDPLPAGLPPPLELGSGRGLGPGDPVVAIGHPEQGAPWTLTSGVLGAKRLAFQGTPGRDVWQMDNALNRGHSGGPLFDRRGLVIGLDQAFARRAADGLALTGIGFALMSEAAARWLKAQGLDVPVQARAYDDALDLARLGLAGQPIFQPGPPGFSLSLAPLKAGFALGEPLRFRVRAEKDARLYLLHRDAQGATQRLLPNRLAPAVLLSAHQARELPARQDGQRWLAQAPVGEEWLLALAATRAVPALDALPEGPLSPAQLRAAESAFDRLPARQRAQAQCRYTIEERP